MLRVEKVAKSFDGFRALKRADLNVDKGEIVAVIGPNGAGKTTLFNVITGHLKPDSGKVSFLDKEITGMASHNICRRGIARSFQLINIFNNLTVFENVQVSVLSRFGKILDIFSSSKKLVQQETLEILVKLGLAEKRNEICSSLSYGDQKVLEMAVAMGNDPELLLLDEPTAGMSIEETKGTIKLIRELAENEGLTILFTEHDIDMVFNTADEIMVLHQGSTIIQGKPDEVRANEQVQKAYLGETG